MSRCDIKIVHAAARAPHNKPHVGPLHHVPVVVQGSIAMAALWHGSPHGPRNAEEVCLHAVKVAVPHERIHEGKEAHGAILAAEREEGGCRFGGDAPDSAAL